MNSYELLAPDLLHEFEIGVWKRIFEHLMRLLQAQGNDVIAEFNRRYVFLSYEPSWKLLMVTPMQHARDAYMGSRSRPKILS